MRPCPLNLTIASLFTRSDHGRSAGLQMVGDELVDVGFNQLAVNDPGLFGQHVAGLGERRRLKKNIPGEPHLRVSPVN